ncbi:MAG: ATP-binding cassette domain-containing protein [Acidimicrobiales bacterium]
MAVIDVNGVSYAHPGGSELFHDVSFRVVSGRHAALIGPNGAGKTTLLQLIAGPGQPVERPTEGSIAVDASVQLMPQAIGTGPGSGTIRELLGRFGPTRLATAAAALVAAERANDASPSEATGIALAEAIGVWGEVGGYHEEARWDACCQRVLRQSFDEARDRPVAELSGGERKRLVLESLFASDVDILLLDEPDNFLDLSAKRWLEQQIASSPKTILLISHDRELLAAAADLIVMVEGSSAWVHPGGFATFDEARTARNADLAASRRRWEEEERRLFQYYKLMKVRASVNDGNAARANAAESRWERFVKAGPPAAPPTQRAVHMNLAGAASGQRVLQVEGLELTGLTEPFDVEVHAGDRVAVLGPNGSGKSHFLRMLGGDATVETSGHWRLGARVQVGLFHQTDEVAWLRGRTPIESLADLDLAPQAAMAALARYGLEDGADRDFDTLSGGQKARLQVLGLELRGVNLLLLDEPTDNLDLLSAEALERALAGFEGTVMCVTHDRWFMRAFDRYLVFDHDCSVKESLELDSALHLVTHDDAYPFRRSSVKDLTRATT